MAKKVAKKTSKKPAKKVSKRIGAVDEGAKSSQSERSGHQLVIVESPAKAKTIEKYLGPGFIVKASVGHIRDLPSRNPKGVKQPVPGVDLENGFEPTYVVSEGKEKTVSELRKLAKGASCIWFATDLDREGESIAWHLAELLKVDPLKAKRVTFDAITKSDVRNAFDHPRPILMDRVEAQQARRILDRIVGYEVSPLLWKKVSGGLSAGRVQSVATRLVVDREREIEAFRPDENWSVTVRVVQDADKASALAVDWTTFMSKRDERGRPPFVRDQMSWMSEHRSLECELVEVHGKGLKIEALSTSKDDLAPRGVLAAEAAGMTDVKIDRTDDAEGRGRARKLVRLSGRIHPAARYAVLSIDTKRTKSRPYPPFITSTLQQAASGKLGFATDRTMRVAQSLYEGVDIGTEGRVGLITYMRTDSTHLSSDAIRLARDYISNSLGAKYLPASPRQFASKSAHAQEAHEAIRPTDPARTPESMRSALNEEQYKLYKLIWECFVACQTMEAEWDSTTILFHRTDQPGTATIKASGRVLAFDGCYRVSGVPSSDVEQTLPALKVGDVVAPFSIEPRQSFQSPPPRFSEASLVKKLEEEGIGRPSTYASIIKVILERGYVGAEDRRLFATDLGMVVTDLLVEEFKDQFIEIGYTRHVEDELDEVAEGKIGWRAMLAEFYLAFKPPLERAHTHLAHVKAAVVPAAWACPTCGARTGYRFGKNGRFLSCTAYPECKYAAPVDRRGRPMLPERVDLCCPADGKAMILRNGRFGEFLTSSDPATKFILNVDKKRKVKFPSPPPIVTDRKCVKCDRPMNLRDGKRGPWLGCSGFPKCRGREPFGKLPDDERATLEATLRAHLASQSAFSISRLDGTPVDNGTAVTDLALPGGEQILAIHPDAKRELDQQKLAEESPA